MGRLQAGGLRRGESFILKVVSRDDATYQANQVGQCFPPSAGGGSVEHCLC